MRKLTLYDYESGRLKPSLEILIKLANFYNLPLEDILGLKKRDPKIKKGVDFKSSTFPLFHFGVIQNESHKLCGLISKDPVILADTGLNEDDFHLPLLPCCLFTGLT